MDTRKRVAIGVAAIAVAVLAIGIGTYAAFTDSEAGPDGTTTGGTLDLETGVTNTAQLFDRTDVAPGFSQPIGITLRNVGNLPGTLTSRVTVSGSDGRCTEPEAEAEGVAAGRCSGSGNLQDQMTVQVVSGPGVSAPTTPSTLAAFAANGLPTAGQIPAGGTATYQLVFALPAAADNRVQGDAVTVGSQFTLTQ